MSYKQHLCLEGAIYSYVCVIIDTWSTGEYEIKLECAWYHLTDHMRVSAVAGVWAMQNEL